MFTRQVIELLAAALIGVVVLTAVCNTRSAKVMPRDTDWGRQQHEDRGLYFWIVLGLMLVVFVGFVGFCAVKVYPVMPEPLKCWPFC